MLDAGFFEPERKPPIVVGHSFGGLTALRYCQLYGEKVGGFVIAESPVRPPNVERPANVSAVSAPGFRVYESYHSALSRFRLLPAQDCVNAFLVEHIARHSIREVDDGWSWKFDPAALTAERHREPFSEYFADLSCKTAFIYGEKSALSTPEVLNFMIAGLNPRSPVIEIPEGQHHLILDQPLAFVASLRAILQGWDRLDTDEIPPL